MSTVTLAVEWRNDKPKGRIEVINGELEGGAVVSGKGAWKKDRFQFAAKGSCRVRFTMAEAKLAPGPNQTRVTVHNGARSFTFFARDVNSANPILLDLYGVMVVPATDRRSYDEVAGVIRAR